MNRGSTPSSSPDTPPHCSHNIRVSESDDSSLNSEELEVGNDHSDHRHSRHHHHSLTRCCNHVKCHHKGGYGKQFKSSNEDSDTGLESLSSAGTPNKRTACFCLEEDVMEASTGSRTRSDSGSSKPTNGTVVSTHHGIQHHPDLEEDLLGEINKLKCDKLDLLRQNVVR